LTQGDNFTFTEAASQPRVILNTELSMFMARLFRMRGSGRSGTSCHSGRIFAPFRNAATLGFAASLVDSLDAEGGDR
jgi:hypothetical protein